MAVVPFVRRKQPISPRKLYTVITKDTDEKANSSSNSSSESKATMKYRKNLHDFNMIGDSLSVSMNYFTSSSSFGE